MINVLIFGLIGNREKIERILGDDVNICGYMDIGAFFDEDIHSYENKPFYTINEIDKVSFDYIVVCSETKNVYFQCEKLLISQGIPMNKIIPTWYLSFCEPIFQSTYDEFLKLDRSFDMAIFGMSFSRMGIVADLLCDSCYKFSQNAMDLHAYEIYIRGLLNNSQHFKNIKQVILDMPYVIFNRDNCASSNILRRMCMYDRFEDYDDFEFAKDAGKRINQYRALKQIMGAKYEKNVSSYSNNFMSLNKVSEDEDLVAGGPWSKLHVETIKKNEERFFRIISMFKKMQVQIILVVFPLNPDFMEQNRYIIEKNKKLFYKRIEKIKVMVGDFEIWDYCKYDYELFPRYYFCDQIHLNYFGAIKMTQLLKKDILSKDRLPKNLPNIWYSVYVPDLGWLPYVNNGEICGTSGVYCGIKGIRIKNNEEDCSLCYQIYSINTGWSELEAKKMELCLTENMTMDAYRIFLSKESRNYILRYRAYIWGNGWSGWLSSGEVAGNTDDSNLIEAIQIEVLRKDNFNQYI